MTWRSKRPGRSRAESRTSGRFVAARTMTPVLPSKPSISVRSWLMVCSRSSFPPPMPAPRWRPTASISSMKTMHGALDLAFSNRSRTRDAPTPTKSSTNSDAAHEKKGTPASPATALARSVFPVPGGPTSKHPLGIFAPSCVYLSGFLRKSTTSWSSSFAPSTPATSTKVTPVSGTSWNLDLDLPKSIGPPPCPRRSRRRPRRPARGGRGRRGRRRRGAGRGGCRGGRRRCPAGHPPRRRCRRRSWRGCPRARGRWGGSRSRDGRPPR